MSKNKEDAGEGQPKTGIRQGRGSPKTSQQGRKEVGITPNTDWSTQPMGQKRMGQPKSGFWTGYEHTATVSESVRDTYTNHVQ